MNYRKIYGYKHFGLFYKRVIEVGENGIRYKNTNYLWSDIIKITRYESIALAIFFSMYGYPMAIIKLSDGKKVYLQGRLMQEEEGLPEFNLLFPTESYNRLVSFIEGKIEGSV